MSLSFRLMSLGLVLLFSGCMSHDYNLKHGIESFQVQDYRAAFIRLLPEAKAGQPDAQYAIGYMYYYGQGVIENRKKAWYWINRAAVGGQADAQNAMAILKQGKPLAALPR
jgi:hypothetical protein